MRLEDLGFERVGLASAFVWVVIHPPMQATKSSNLGIANAEHKGEDEEKMRALLAIEYVIAACKQTTRRR